MQARQLDAVHMGGIAVDEKNMKREPNRSGEHHEVALIQAERFMHTQKVHADGAERNAKPHQPRLLWPTNTPITGTSTTYMAVIKPALPAVVSTMPICCNVEPINKAMPHKIPPVKSVFRSDAAAVPVRRLSKTAAELRRPSAYEAR